jgi:hypothetical protein
MKVYSGNLRKMKALHKSPVEYYLNLGEEEISLNQFIGSRLQWRYTGNIHCIQCHKKTKNSFQQGYCYPCMQRLAECQFCVIHPEKCRVMHSECPPEDWAHQQCRQTHIVYLANSSGLKVGVTRATQTPTRWIDQGAVQALPILQTANRYQSGVIEVGLKQFVNDKTDWRKMLKNPAEPLNLLQERDELLEKSQNLLKDVTAGFGEDVQGLSHSTVTELHYPVEIYPLKPLTLSFDKSPVFEGKLWGIKGQYLILDTGVFNVRKFAGYEVQVIFNSN